MKMLVSMLLAMGVVLYLSRFMVEGSFPIPGLGTSPDASEQGLGEIGNITVEQDVTVYRWTDAQGVTHFGGTPPTGQGEYSKKEILANTNVMQATRTQEEKEETKQRPRVASVGSVYSPEGIKDLMDNTKDLQKQMNDRVAQQEKMMQDILGQKK